MMKLSKQDFSFFLLDSGIYRVMFFALVSNRCYHCNTTDYELINLTLNTNNPKQKDLIKLKKLCKQNTNSQKRN